MKTAPQMGSWHSAHVRSRGALVLSAGAGGSAAAACAWAAAAAAAAAAGAAASASTVLGVGGTSRSSRCALSPPPVGAVSAALVHVPSCEPFESWPCVCSPRSPCSSSLLSSASPPGVHCV
eukprot:2602814-Prymnesium_polylepis.1